MALNIPLYKTVALVQGGADAFVQSTITTEINPSDGLVWKILGVEVGFDPSLMMLLSADSWVMWQITRDTKTATTNYVDQDVVMLDGFSNSLTTSGEVLVPLSHKWEPIGDLIFAEPTMYLALDSANTGQVLSATMRVYYEMVKATEIEILRMLQNV
jgi:hypothetical protein